MGVKKKRPMRMPIVLKVRYRGFMFLGGFRVEVGTEGGPLTGTIKARKWAGKKQLYCGFSVCWRFHNRLKNGAGRKIGSRVRSGLSRPLTAQSRLDGKAHEILLATEPTGAKKFGAWNLRVSF